MNNLNFSKPSRFKIRRQEEFQSFNSRIIIVSHRLPIALDQKGNIIFEDSPTLGVKNPAIGAAVKNLKEQGREIIWVGYAGICPETQKEREIIREKIFKEFKYVPVFFDANTAKLYFSGFCKGVLFPLFHYYDTYEASKFSEKEWLAYKRANESFAETLEFFIQNVPSSQEGPDLICIQDYHLMLLPNLLKEKQIQPQIGFFLHVPWPSSEVYRSLSVRKEILRGVLGADIVGLQTFAYVRHFLSTCTRLMGLPIHERGILVEGHFVQVECAPTGIDPQAIKETLNSTEVKSKIEELNANFKGKKILVSRDRTEYIKGIPHKLRAFATFLKKYPEMRDKVILIQECRPNLEVESPSYLRLIEEIHQLVGNINGVYSTVTHSPIYYVQKKNPSWEESWALFSIADCCLITSLRDGMNLTCHEFAIANNKKSPIILSEFTGSAHCLSGAILVNPWDEDRVAEAIYEALTLSEEEKEIRSSNNCNYVLKNTANYWIETFLRELADSKKFFLTEAKPMNKSIFQDIKTQLSLSKKRLFLCELEGSLQPFQVHPSLISLPPSLISSLKNLASDERNEVWIISSRDRNTLKQWFSDPRLGLVAEQGTFFYFPNASDWERNKEAIDSSWHALIKPVFDDFSDNTPGSETEVNEVNVTWYYRGVDPTFGEYQKNNLLLHLQGLPNFPIEIVSGEKFVRVQPAGVNKRTTVKRILDEQKDVDFALCLGDESMFDEVKKHSIPYIKTIVVDKELVKSRADYFLKQDQIIAFLNTISSNT